jgi:hypothetical protein
MHRCSTCNNLISHNRPHIRAEVVGVETHWCKQACFDEWNQQNMVFTISADPFAPRRHTTRARAHRYEQH